MKTLYSTEAGRFYSENNTNKIKYNNNGEKVHLSVLEDTTSGKRYLQVARKLSWLEKLLNKINAAISTRSRINRQSCHTRCSSG